MSTPVLHVEHVTMQCGGVVAVNDLSMDVYDREIVALIGPNGAGKTTAFNCITGVYEPTNGRVDFLGEPIVCNHPHGKMKKIYAGEGAERYLDQRVVSYTPVSYTHLVLKLKSDYLAIATLGFAEIIRALVQLEAFAPVTNGSQLLRGFPYFLSLIHI